METQKTYYHGTTREYYEANMREHNGVYTHKIEKTQLVLESLKDQYFAKNYRYKIGHVWLTVTPEFAAGYAWEHAKDRNQTPIILEVNSLSEDNGKLVCNGDESFGDYYLSEGNLRPEQVKIIDITLEQAHAMAYGKLKLEDILETSKK